MSNIDPAWLKNKFQILDLSIHLLASKVSTG